VKLEGLQLSGYSKKLQNLFHPDRGLIDMDELKQQLRTECAKLEMRDQKMQDRKISAPFRDACFIRLFVQYVQHAVINWIEIWRI